MRRSSWPGDFLANLQLSTHDRLSGTHTLTTGRARGSARTARAGATEPLGCHDRRSDLADPLDLVGAAPRADHAVRGLGSLGNGTATSPAPSRASLGGRLQVRAA